MKPKPVILISGLLLGVTTCSAEGGGPPAAGATIATVSRVISDVTKKVENKQWQKAKMGEVLGTGDRLKTGEHSIAIIKFKDNSLVRVRSRSELTVTGKQSGTAFSKTVDLDRGGIGFSIAKQRSDEEFRFSSPTSVASIRGTGGQYIVSPEGDTLTVLTGDVKLTNSHSSKSEDVGAGFTGISTPDGGLFTRLATDNEKRSAEDALRSGDQPMRLEFELRDGQGKTQNLRIDYKQ